MKIRKGDNVMIMSGKDRGKSGKVLRVLPKMDKVLVEGFNLAKKAMRPKKQGQKGEIVSVARPLHASNVMILCGSCKKAARVGYKMEGEQKVRYCKNCSAHID
jgi:large subunit ribosomal protein L24